MSGMLNRNILRALYRANFEKIITYILDICALIVKDYEERQLKLPNDENKIRSIMLEEYMNKQKAAHGMSVVLCQDLVQVKMRNFSPF